MATKDGTYKPGAEKGPYHKANDGQRAIDKMGEKDYAEYKEVQQLNKDSVEYYQDPEYDLYDEGVELGSGAFGTVYMGADGRSVIKDGQIGRDELQVMDLLKDVTGFPKLLKGEFNTGFKSIETWENDGITVEPDSDGFGDSFWHNAQAAKGRFAMSLAGGEQVSDALYGWNETTRSMLLRSSGTRWQQCTSVVYHTMTSTVVTSSGMRMKKRSTSLTWVSLRSTV